VADPDRDFNLGDFVRAADAAVAGILARGRVPIVAGGTGMYVRGFLKGIDPAPPRDARVRDRLDALASRRGEAQLHRILARLDPAAAAAVHPADRLRLIRGVERVLLTGRPAGAARWGGPDRYLSVKVGIRIDHRELARRIEARVDRMVAGGLIEETRGLLAAGLGPGRSALKALGYREAVAHLRGELDLPAATEAIKRHTRQFARRQMVWFRREPAVRWFPLGPGGDTALAAVVEKYVRLRLGVGAGGSAREESLT